MGSEKATKDIPTEMYERAKKLYAEVVRARLQPGQYAHIVPEGRRLTVEIGPKPETPAPRWRVGQKCDPLDPPPIGTWVHVHDTTNGAYRFPAMKLVGMQPNHAPWQVKNRVPWRHAWIAQPPPGERQPWEVE